MKALLIFFLLLGFAFLLARCRTHDRVSWKLITSPWLGLWAVHRSHANTHLSSFPSSRLSKCTFLLVVLSSRLWCWGYSFPAVGLAVNFPSLVRVSVLTSPPPSISSVSAVPCQVPLHHCGSQGRTGPPHRYSHATISASLCNALACSLQNM